MPSRKIWAQVEQTAQINLPPPREATLGSWSNLDIQLSSILTSIRYDQLADTTLRFATPTASRGSPRQGVRGEAPQGSQSTELPSATVRLAAILFHGVVV